MKRGKLYYSITAVFGLLMFLFFRTDHVVMRILFGLVFVSAIFRLVALIIKERREKILDETHSSAFKEIMRVADSGYLRSYQSFYPEMLDGLYDWERKETEDFIWSSFHDRGYLDMAPLLPKLTRYDGVAGLKEKLSSLDEDNEQRKNIARVLYAATGDEKYNMIH